MATYYNDFDKKTDYMMWQLHEVRHKIQKEKIDINEINEHAKTVINNWKKNKKSNNPANFYQPRPKAAGLVKIADFECYTRKIKEIKM